MPPTLNLPGDPRQNKLLGALPVAEWQRLRGHLEPVKMALGGAVRESGTQLAYGYFPTTSIISLYYAAPDGASTEIATVGNEGLVGVALVLGGGGSPSCAVVQTMGWAYRIDGDILQKEFFLGGAIQRLLLRYTQALLTLIGQTAVCNRRHSIDQQLCRWLLLNIDRLASMELIMTHEMLGNMLGVRREGISEAAHKLRSAGLISYHRGRITVIDRPGLEVSCCECYEIVRREYSRLLRDDGASTHSEPSPREAFQNHVPMPDANGSRNAVRKRTIALTSSSPFRSDQPRHQAAAP